MRTIPLRIPDTLDITDRDILKIVASKLYETGKLSLGQAAGLAGMTKRALMEDLGSCGVAIFPMDAAELERDIRNA